MVEESNIKIKTEDGKILTIITQPGADGIKGDKGDKGLDGKDGKDGADGKDGKNGKDGKQGSKGERGEDGKDGKDGKNGKDGKDLSSETITKLAKKLSKDSESNLLWVNNGAVKSVVAGSNVTVDNTDPQNPIISSTGGGGGAVDSVNGQTGVVVLDAGDVGAVPYTGATANVDLDAKSIATAKVIITDGYISPANQTHEIRGSTLHDDLEFAKLSGSDQSFRFDFSLLSAGSPRTYSVPDSNGTIALTSDITGTNSGTNTGDQTFQTNGTPNPTQNLLNLVQGTNMTITDDGVGNITFDATGGGGGTEGKVGFNLFRSSGLQVGDGFKTIVEYNGTITGWIIATQDGSSSTITLSVKKTDYASLPTFTSIDGTEQVELSASLKNTNTSLSTWTTALVAGDHIEITVESVTGVVTGVYGIILVTK